MNAEDVEHPATPLELSDGAHAGHANLVHLTFVPTQALVRPVAATSDGPVRPSSDAHRFNASLAEADAAMVEWRSFVDEVRARMVSRSR